MYTSLSASKRWLRLSHYFPPHLCAHLSVWPRVSMQFNRPAVQIYFGGYCSPLLSPIPLLHPPEYDKDLTCCIKLSPAVYNCGKGWGYTRVRMFWHGFSRYPETCLAQSACSHRSKRKSLRCTEAKWQLRYGEHGCVVRVLPIHHCKQEIMFSHPDKSSSRQKANTSLVVCLWAGKTAAHISTQFMLSTTVKDMFVVYYVILGNLSWYLFKHMHRRGLCWTIRENNYNNM